MDPFSKNREWQEEHARQICQASNQNTYSGHGKIKAGFAVG